MPNSDNMLFIRPENCHDCIWGYYALLHVIDYARRKGWNAIDIAGENANKTPVFESLNQDDPAGIYGFGHGNSCVYTGDSEQTIFSCYQENNLEGRAVYLLSCLTANGLGPEIIRQGALAYAGFNISWTWLAEFVGDPYHDLYARGFYEGANEFWLAMIDGKTWGEATQASIDKYNYWIDYWFEENPEDPYSQTCIKWLAHDRDGLVSLDICDVLTEENSCLAENCYWYNNSCHSSPEKPQTAGGIALAFLPIIAVVGIAFIIGEYEQ